MLPYRMILALQSKFLPAFGVRPPVSSRRRTPKSHSFCSLHRSLRIFPLLTFNFQLSTFNFRPPFPPPGCSGLAGLTSHWSPTTSHLSLFSCTYKLPIFYPLCFDIHASDGGCTPLLIHKRKNS